MDEKRPSLVALAAALSAAKQAESEARARRLELETAIIAATGFEKPEGQQKFAEEGEDGSCELVLKQPITTNVDDAEWEKVRRSLENNHPGRKVFLKTYKLDTRAARKLQDEQPALWADVAKAVTRKPGKVQVELKSVTLVQRGSS